MRQFGRRGFLTAVGLGGASIGLSTRRVVAEAGRSAGLTVRGNEFLLDGQPFQILSGAMHYFRTHPDQWRDRLSRLRALGLNTVETYIAWNFHETRRGRVDFTGWCDVVEFVNIAADLGLKAVLRPGPYICAEWDFGGFPAWLLENPGLPLRVSDPAYLKLVDDWFATLLPRLAPLQATRGGPVIAFQVENEYGSYGDDHTYLEHVRSTMRDHGIDSLLFCSNGPSEETLRAGTIPGTLATVNFSGDPDEPFAALREFQPEGPLWCTEYWDGWFDHWGEQHHTTNPADDAASIEKMVSSGASINLYMAVGGTNFEWWSGANYDDGKSVYQPTVTSYDYDAPIGESGDLREKFHRIREVLARHAPVVHDPPRVPPRLPEQEFSPHETVALLESLDVLSSPLRLGSPVHMERLGQPHGLIHYRTRVRAKGKLTVAGLADRVLVFHDGAPVGTLDRNNPGDALDITAPGTLDLLVDAGGRINFGKHLNDPKGIAGDVRLDSQPVHDWEIRPLPLDDLSGLRFRPDGQNTPAFHRAAIRISQPADGFLALPGWSKGLVWLNGFLLGRYWSIGPQRTLYAPSPLWKSGDNEIIVLELDKPGGTIELRSAPDLG